LYREGQGKFFLPRRGQGIMQIQHISSDYTMKEQKSDVLLLDPYGAAT
jgi:hypothetical protein